MAFSRKFMFAEVSTLKIIKVYKNFQSNFFFFLRIHYKCKLNNNLIETALKFNRIESFLFYIYIHNFRLRQCTWLFKQFSLEHRSINQINSADRVKGLLKSM